MDVLVAVPTFESIRPETYKSIYALDPAGCDLSFDFIKGFDCAIARNRIARAALDGGFDKVLMVDSDVVLPGDALRNMLDPESDIVIGCYKKRGSSQLVDVFKADSFSYANRFSIEEVRQLDHRVKTNGGGAGCTLVSVDVFRHLKFPWFSYQQVNEADMLSEDLYFFAKAINAGHDVWFDPRVKCGHVLAETQWL